MKLVNALETLKEMGITQLVGLCGETNIDKYIANARRCDEDAQKYIEQSWAQYHIAHAEDNFIIEMGGGKYIIATWYNSDVNKGTRFYMATYGNYETEAEMNEAFYFWKIKQEANEIAEEMMIKKPGQLTKEEWVLIAAAELREQKKLSAIAFAKEFKTSISHYYL